MDRPAEGSVAEALTLWEAPVRGSGPGPLSPSASLTAGRASADPQLVRRVLAGPRARLALAGAADIDKADYVLGDLIGQGGMGRVFAATQVALERTVAVKVLRDELMDDPRSHELFLAEALVSAELEHPNTLPVYGI